jgi:hypothetical protein
MGDDIFPDELYHDIITDQQQAGKSLLTENLQVIIINPIRKIR